MARKKQATRPRRKTRPAGAARPRRRLPLVAAGIAAALLVAEVSLRLLPTPGLSLLRLNRVIESERGKFSRYHDRLGWIGRDRVDDTFEWVDCSHRVRQNEHGFRGPDHPFARTGARRAVVLGDSFVWGFGVEDDEIFTHLVERAADPPLEVVNLGVSGYGPDQELLLWRELGRNWQPDTVVLLVTPYTDLVDVASNERHGYAKPVFRLTEDGELRLANVPVPTRREWAEKAERSTAPPSWAATLLGRSVTANLVVTNLARLEVARRWLEGGGLIFNRRPGYDWEHLVFQVDPDPEIARAWAVLEAVVATFASEVRAAGAELVVALAPSPVQVYPELWARFRARVGEAPGELDRELPNRRLAAVAARVGVGIVDLLPDLRAAAATDPYLYFPVNDHWTAAGHRVVAERLGRELVGD